RRGPAAPHDPPTPNRPTPDRSPEPGPAPRGRTPCPARGRTARGGPRPACPRPLRVLSTTSAHAGGETPARLLERSRGTPMPRIESTPGRAGGDPAFRAYGDLLRFAAAFTQDFSAI